MASSIRIVLDRVVGSGMKAPEGALNALRCRHPIMNPDQVAPHVRPIWAGVEEVADPLAQHMGAPMLTDVLYYPDPPTDFRAPPAAGVAAREPVGPRVVHHLRAGWRWLVQLNDRIEDCWIGDWLGGVSLMLIGIGAFIAVGGAAMSAPFHDKPLAAAAQVQKVRDLLREALQARVRMYASSADEGLKAFDAGTYADLTDQLVSALAELRRTGDLAALQNFLLRRDGA